MSATILLAGGGTGGHVFPMIAVADALRAELPELNLVFLGTPRGMETRLVPAAGYTLELSEVLPIRGGGVAGALRGIARAAASLPEARALLRRLAPRAVFSIGGYAAGPVCVAAKSLGIPLALMEPNSVIGMANWLIARLCERAYTAFPESEKHFRKATVLRAGVPIRAGFQPVAYQRAGVFKLLVLGGSQGAKALNDALPEVASGLSAAGFELQITHQAGAGNAAGLAERYAAQGQSERAQVLDFVDDMPARIAWADLVIGRAGASAVSEVCAVGRGSVLIPYPYAAGDHQRFNALSLARDGAARVVLQQEATSARLTAVVAELLGQPSALTRMAECARERGRPAASQEIAKDLLGLAGLAPDRRGGREPKPASPKRTNGSAGGGHLAPARAPHGETARLQSSGAVDEARVGASQAQSLEAR